MRLSVSLYDYTRVNLSERGEEILREYAARHPDRKGIQRALEQLERQGRSNLKFKVHDLLLVFGGHFHLTASRTNKEHPFSAMHFTLAVEWKHDISPMEE